MKDKHKSTEQPEKKKEEEEPYIQWKEIQKTLNFLLKTGENEVLPDVSSAERKELPIQSFIDGDFLQQ